MRIKVHFLIHLVNFLFQAQVVLLIILLFAIADFFLGTLIGHKSDIEYARGFIGYNGNISFISLQTFNF